MTQCSNAKSQPQWNVWLSLQRVAPNGRKVVEGTHITLHAQEEAHPKNGQRIRSNPSIELYVVVVGEYLCY